MILQRKGFQNIINADENLDKLLILSKINLKSRYNHSPNLQKLKSQN